MKLFPLLLIFILLYNSIGYIIVHFYRTAVIRSEILELIHTNSFNQELTILVFSKYEINCDVPVINRIDEKEFRYNGGMYDIVKEEIKGDSIYFYCIFDKEEGLLDLLFAQHFEKQNSENSPNTISPVAQFKFVSEYLLKDKFYPPCIQQISNYKDHPDHLILLICLEILTPPPKISKSNIT